MKYTRVIPIVTTRKLAEVKEFYTTRFNCQITFEGYGYLGIRLPGEEGPELGFMLPECEDQPTFQGQGMTFGLQVADVDGEYDRLHSQNPSELTEPEDRPWGDRAFTLQDPVGTYLYIHQPIPPAPEFAQYIKS